MVVRKQASTKERDAENKSTNTANYQATQATQTSQEGGSERTFKISLMGCVLHLPLATMSEARGIWKERA
jgi:hypothetical protein